LPELDQHLSAAVAAIEAEAASQAAAQAPRDYAALVWAAFNDTIPNSPASRSAEVLNHLTQVFIPALVAALTKG